MKITVERAQPAPPPPEKVVVEFTLNEWHDLCYILVAFDKAYPKIVRERDQAADQVGRTPDSCYTYNVWGLISTITKKEIK